MGKKEVEKQLIVYSAFAMVIFLFYLCVKTILSPNYRKIRPFTILKLFH